MHHTQNILYIYILSYSCQGHVFIQAHTSCPPNHNTLLTPSCIRTQRQALHPGVPKIPFRPITPCSRQQASSDPSALTTAWARCQAQCCFIFTVNYWPGDLKIQERKGGEIENRTGFRLRSQHQPKLTKTPSFYPLFLSWVQSPAPYWREKYLIRTLDSEVSGYMK